ncbi:MAG: hypothetical protein GY839_13980 [candidate division Zixibacteria bacterium]|nr:hypothetical protein [candidate division Zixibacteria bacterium]
MLKANRAAILIAVFLLFSLQGCYTKLKSAKPRLVPDETSGQDYRDWDFGYGWYRPGIEVYSSYFGFYYGQWWDNCSWCDENNYAYYDNTGASETETEEGKIKSRDDNVYPHHQYQHVIPSDNSSRQKIDIPPPANNSEPKSYSNNQSKSKSNTSNRSSGKIKRRSRR